MRYCRECTNRITYRSKSDDPGICKFCKAGEPRKPILRVIESEPEYERLMYHSIAIPQTRIPTMDEQEERMDFEDE